MKKCSLFLTLLLIFVIAIISGCSNGDNNSTNASSDEIDTSEELIIGTGADPTSLDPRQTWSGPGYSMNAHMLEPLVFRSIEDGEVEIEGVLAKEYENIDDTTWKFTLEEDVVFHNGEPFTSESVKYTLESILDPDTGSPLIQWVEDIEEITTDGDHTVYIETKTPTRSLIGNLAQVPIIDKKAAEELGDQFNVEPVGTGPYEIVEYKANTSVEMERFDDYWGEPGESEKIKFMIMPENSTRLAALKKGDVHIAENISADKVDEVEDDPNLDFKSTETLRVNMLVNNFDNEWVQEKKFREALSLSIDRELLVDNILGGNTVAASSPSPRGTIGFDDDSPVYEYNPDKAEELLDEINYDGSTIKLGIPSGRYVMDRQVGEAISGMFEQTGIDVDLEILEFSSFVPKADEGYYDVDYIGAADLTIDPYVHLVGYVHSKGTETGYSNSELDELMSSSIEALDDDEAAEIFRDVQEFVYDEKPIMPLYYEPYMVGVRKEVKGYEPRLDEYVIVKDAYLE